MISLDGASVLVARRMLRQGLLIIGATCACGTAVAEESKAALAQALFDDALTSARIADVGFGLGVIGLGVAFTPGRGQVSASMKW